MPPPLSVGGGVAELCERTLIGRPMIDLLQAEEVRIGRGDEVQETGETTGEVKG